MDISTIDIKWIGVILLVVNLAPLLLLRTARKYFLLSVPLWIVLLLVFILTLQRNNATRQNIEQLYAISFANKTGGEHDLLVLLQETEKKISRENKSLFGLLGAQTMIAFVLQVIGYRNGQFRRTYGWLIILFLIALIAYLVLEFLPGMVPQTWYAT